MPDNEIDWLVYVDSPDWSRARPREWRHYIADDLRAIWPTLTYEQKWTLAQHAAKIAIEAPSVNVNARRRFGNRLRHTPVDRPDAPIPTPSSTRLGANWRQRPHNAAHAKTSGTE